MVQIILYSLLFHFLPPSLVLTPLPTRKEGDDAPSQLFEDSVLNSGLQAQNAISGNTLVETFDPIFLQHLLRGLCPGGDTTLAGDDASNDNLERD